MCGAWQAVHAPVSCTCLLLQAGLVPGSYVGMGNNGTGCFTRGTDVSMGRGPIGARHTPAEHTLQSFMHACANAYSSLHCFWEPLQASQKALSLS